MTLGTDRADDFLHYGEDATSGPLPPAWMTALLRVTTTRHLTLCGPALRVLHLPSLFSATVTLTISANVAYSLIMELCLMRALTHESIATPGLRKIFIPSFEMWEYWPPSKGADLRAFCAKRDIEVVECMECWPEFEFEGKIDVRDIGETYTEERWRETSRALVRFPFWGQATTLTNYDCRRTA